MTKLRSMVTPRHVQSESADIWTQLIKLNWAEELESFRNVGAPSLRPSKLAAFKLTDFGLRALPAFIDYGKLFQLTECNNNPGAKAMPPVGISEWMANIDKIREKIKRREDQTRKSFERKDKYRSRKTGNKERLYVHLFVAAIFVSCVTASITVYLRVNPLTSKIIMAGAIAIVSWAILRFYERKL